jgi:hypothetical protein
MWPRATKAECGPDAGKYLLNLPLNRAFKNIYNIF